MPRKARHERRGRAGGNTTLNDLRQQALLAVQRLRQATDERLAAIESDSASASSRSSDGPSCTRWTC
jgi:hypothetical protein